MLLEEGKYSSVKIKENMSQTSATNFDSSALAGLRGISALHIVVFHSFTYCLFEFNVYAQVSPIHIVLLFYALNYCYI